MELVLTDQADADYDDIIEASERMFGAAQAAKYEALLFRTFAMIEADPAGGVSKAHPPPPTGVRSLHMSRAARRRRAASHLVFYRMASDDQVIVLRILHEAMDPYLHLTDS